MRNITRRFGIERPYHNWVTLSELFHNLKLLPEMDYYYLQRHFLIEATASELVLRRQQEGRDTIKETDIEGRAAFYEEVFRAAESKLKDITSLNLAVLDKLIDFSNLDHRDALVIAQRGLWTWEEVTRALTEPIEFIHLRWDLNTNGIIHQHSWTARNWFPPGMP
jgi:hypothetical protein